MSELRQHPTTNTGVPANGEHGMAQAGVQVMSQLLADGGAAEFRVSDAGGDTRVLGQRDAQQTEAHEITRRPSTNRLQRQTTEGELRQVRAEKAALVGWPFMYSYRGDTIIVNKAQPKSKYQEAEAVGFADF